MRSTRFSEASFITLSAKSSVLRDKVQLQRGEPRLLRGRNCV